MKRIHKIEAQQIAQEIYALCNKGTCAFTWEEHEKYRRLEHKLAESRYCPECAAYDGSLQETGEHEGAENPEEHGGSYCGTCEAFIVWGPQCEYEYATGDDGYSDADPGL